MSLIRVSSPHLSSSGNTGDVMLLVALAMLPGIAMQIWYFGWGTLINLGWACFVALSAEALVMALRRRPVLFYLRDYSAIVTALLIGVSLPPLAPWWVTLIAVSFAIIFAKHLYGGLGQNPFNPAMVGYALVLVSFPVEMTSWLPPRALQVEHALTFTETLHHIFPFIAAFTGMLPVDAFTMATPLDTFKHRGDIPAADAWLSEPILSPASWQAWKLVSLGYLIGGCYLIYRRVMTWHAPVSMLATLGIIASLFWWINPEAYATPELHLLGGATLIGAFFIVTDPVSSCTSTRGKLVFGAGVALLIYVIRTWGSYPDAVAFAVLLMNFAAPFIDYYTQPRTYGHSKANRGSRQGG